MQDLIRLSLSDPDNVSVHHKSASATPEKLTQAYIVAELPSKIDVLYSFLRSHLKVCLFMAWVLPLILFPLHEPWRLLCAQSKTIVFLSSCKQVRFVYEALRRLRPGVPLMALHGKQKQGHRVGIFKDFSKKTEAVLFATDIAARGLDFPGVDWVVQLDCPEDADTYIHRVGRTARFNRDGKALLVLLPSEVAMVEQLAARRVPLLKTEVDPSKIVELAPKLQALCAEEAELKYLAQRVRSWACKGGGLGWFFSFCANAAFCFLSVLPHTSARYTFNPTRTYLTSIGLMPRYVYWVIIFWSLVSGNSFSCGLLEICRVVGAYGYSKTQIQKGLLPS